MPTLFDLGRRHFLGSAAMAVAAHLTGVGMAAANQNRLRQLTALDRAKVWLETPAPSIAELPGRVVLVQFGTYTCINWLRTLPYIRAWARKYRHGLSVIGVHTPEFPFEAELERVRAALGDMKLEFSIAIDSDRSVWRAFNNRYWPALYLIDARGRLRHHHFGEGEYAGSEAMIRSLLAEVGIGSDGTDVAPIPVSSLEVQADWRSLKSPEMYLGFDRATAFSSPGGGELGQRVGYTVPKHLRLNQWALDGQWTIENGSVVLNKAPGRLLCRFHARDVHLVLGRQRREPEVRFRVSLDGAGPGTAHGSDVDDGGHGAIVDPRLYQLVRQSGTVVERTVAIEFLDPGAEAFAFTFG